MAWLVEISTPTPTGWLLVSQYALERSARRTFTRMQRTIGQGVSLRLVHNLETIEVFRQKNAAAVALGRKRAHGVDMAAIGKRGGIAARGKSGRPRSPRCPCGAYTLHTAQVRRHKCEAAS